VSSFATTPVLILCGGLGTRLREVVSDRPKGLAPIGDTPFLHIQIELLKRQGARRFVLCVGHQGELIQNYFGDGSALGVQVDYSFETAGKLMGTAGAIRLALAHFEPRAIVINGDTYLDVDYTQVLDHHNREQQSSGVLGSLTVSKLDDTTRFGSVVLDETERLVVGFREKQAAQSGQSGWLNAGVYVLERELVESIPTDRPVSIERETFPELLARSGKLVAFRCQAPFYDIGTPDDFRTFQEVYRGLVSANRS
jgi:NDP-sugar pyrophosphorylase family protein